MYNILIQYLQWHYIDEPKAILRAWKGFLLFNLNYWSTYSLLKTYFSPWRKYHYSYREEGAIDFKRIFKVWIANVFARTIGMIMRTFLIIAGIIAEILAVFLGIIIFIGWLFLPILLILGILYGFGI